MNIEISERKTFKFNSGWDGCDDWEHLGEAKVLAPRNHRWDGESGGYTVRVIASSAMRDRDISHAISQSLSPGTCRHEHDCCGCVGGWADAVRVGSREYLVKVHLSRNV